MRVKSVKFHKMKSFLNSTTFLKIYLGTFIVKKMFEHGHVPLLLKYRLMNRFPPITTPLVPRVA